MSNFKKVEVVSKRWSPRDATSQGIPDPPCVDSVLKPCADSNIGTGFAELTVYVKIWFEPLAVPPGATTGVQLDGNSPGIPFNYRAWGPGDDFPGLCRDICAKAQAAWTGKLYLIAPARYDGLDWDTDIGTFRPPIKCNLVVLAGDASYHHFHVKIVLPTGPVTPSPSIGDFRQNSTMWSRAATDTVTFPSAVGNHTQVTCAHEVGHIIGLQHIGRYTQVANCNLTGPYVQTSSNACYGAAETANASLPANIMGLGMSVAAQNIRPWAFEMSKHANSSKDWHLNPFGGADDIKPDEWLVATSPPGQKQISSKS